MIKIQKDDGSDSAASDIDILDVSDAEPESDRTELKDRSSSVDDVVETEVSTAEKLVVCNVSDKEETVNVVDHGEAQDMEPKDEMDEIPEAPVRENGMCLNIIVVNILFWYFLFDLIEYPLMNYKGEMIYFPNPTEEVFLDKDKVSESEREFHYDFFDGSGKTRNPQRYLKIRNFILESW